LITQGLRGLANGLRALARLSWKRYAQVTRDQRRRASFSLHHRLLHHSAATLHKRWAFATTQIPRPMAPSNWRASLGFTTRLTAVTRMQVFSRPEQGAPRENIASRITFSDLLHLPARCLHYTHVNWAHPNYRSALLHTRSRIPHSQRGMLAEKPR
jgi:hypothetical protein